MMSLSKAWPLILAAVLAVAPEGAFPQWTTATCLPIFNWMDNTLNQNPCLISSYLASACLSQLGSSEITSSLAALGVTAASPGAMYPGPSADTANECMCNTVTYSMISACGACQNGTVESWSAYKFNCTMPYYSTFPMNIPNGTVVPHWAYLDVVNAPESSAPVQSTSSIISSTTSVSASLTTSSTAATASSSPTSTSKTGGVVGGVVIVAIASVAAWFFVRRRRSKIAPSKAFSNTSGNTQSVYSTHPNQFPIMTQQPLYVCFLSFFLGQDPSNPSTFPATPPAVPPTSSTNIYQNSSIPSRVYSQPSRPGQYSGAPEV
ncbi:hypothetical protein M405DRAFT_874248 [Rhizopogon salebrosus TDB-379]|nr:hypothetical protein M405DRAFT_874248 [Rhizopogon salebrosus TDB-379]